MLLLVVASILASLSFVTANLQNEDRNYYKLSEWSNIETSLNLGDNKGFYTIQQYNDLISSYATEFPEIIAGVVNIGTTHNGQSIKAIHLSKSATRLLEQTENPRRNLNIQNYQNQHLNKPALLLAGMLEGSDPNSMDMCLYILKRFIFGVVHNEQEYIDFLQTRQIWIIPMINIDTYQIIENKISSNQQISSFSIKNRNTATSCSNTDDNGVNLRINFPLSSDVNLNAQPCDPLYRGTQPLSENESQAISNFIDNSGVKFKIALNFFSKNNAFYVPISYSQTRSYNDQNLYQNTIDLKVFESFKTNLYSSANSSTYFGTYYSKHNSVLLGEISDYLYKQKQIYSFSVDLGAPGVTTNPLYDPIENLKVLRLHYPLIHYSLYKLKTTFYWSQLYVLTENCLEQHLKVVSCKKPTERIVYSTKVRVHNDGLEDSGEFQVTIKGPKDLTIVSVKLQDEYTLLYNFQDTAPNQTLTFQTHPITNEQSEYSFIVSNVAQMSNKIISITGMYTEEDQEKDTSKLVTFQVDNKDSFENKHMQNYTMENYGGVTGFKKIIIDQVIEYHPRKASMVLLIAYFSLVAIIGFVVIIISLVAAKVKKAESRLILDEGKPAEDKSIN